MIIVIYYTRTFIPPCENDSSLNRQRMRTSAHCVVTHEQAPHSLINVTSYFKDETGKPDRVILKPLKGN